MCARIFCHYACRSTLRSPWWSYATTDKTTSRFTGILCRWSCCLEQSTYIGPVLFLLYTADVPVIAQRHGFLAHSYADDTQLYFYDKVSLTAFEGVYQWDRKMDASNCLRLNTDNTVYMSGNAAAEWLSFSITLSTLKLHHFQLPLRSPAWQLSSTASYFLRACYIRGSTLLLSYEADSCSQEVTD